MLLNFQILMDLMLVYLNKRINKRLAAEISLTGLTGNSKFGKDCKKRAQQKTRMESQSSS